MKYRLNIKTLTGQILTYKINEYKIEDDFVIFYDDIQKVTKKFHSTNVEITEVKE